MRENTLALLCVLLGCRAQADTRQPDAWVDPPRSADQDAGADNAAPGGDTASQAAAAELDTPMADAGQSKLAASVPADRR